MGGIRCLVVLVFACYMTKECVHSQEVLFKPYRCQTAIAGVSFHGLTPELQSKNTGVTYSLGIGPSSLTIDPTTGVPSWQSPIEGRHVVRIIATSGNNSDEVEWILRVVPKYSDTVAIVSTRHIDFVLNKPMLRGNAFIERKAMLDQTWETYSQLVGQEPITDRQVILWKPGNYGAYAGNPITLGDGGAHPEKSENDWERWGFTHELAHNFNFLVRTPGKWSSVHENEGFDTTWMDRYLHHLTNGNVAYAWRCRKQDPAGSGLNTMEARQFANWFEVGKFGRGTERKNAASFKKMTEAGTTMEDAAKKHNGIYGFLMNEVMDKHGEAWMEEFFRLIRHDGLPDEIFASANNTMLKFTLLVCLYSEAAGKDLRPLFKQYGFRFDEEYYNTSQKAIAEAKKKLLPRDVWNNGWLKSPVNGHEYRILTWKTDWEQANRTARQWGGRLVEIHSDLEQEWVARRFAHLGPVWLGLRNLEGKNDWRWVSGQQELSPRWNPNNPGENSSNYAILGAAQPRGTWRRPKPNTQAVVLVERLRGATEISSKKAPTATALSAISTDAAKNKVGEVVTVKLKVRSTGASGQMMFLNSNANYRDDSNFAIVIMDTFLADEKAPANPRAFYNGKSIEVTGTVSLYQTRARIVVTSPSQITTR